MTSFPWIIVGIVLGLIVTGISIILVLKRRKEIKSQNTNYRAFFILGISFLLLGIIFEITFIISSTQVFLILGLSFIAIGISYISIGLANKDKWNKVT